MVQLNPGLTTRPSRPRYKIVFNLAAARELLFFVTHRLSFTSVQPARTYCLAAAVHPFGL